MQYLLELQDIMDGAKGILFLDNFRVHHSSLVKEELRGSNIKVVYNVPYSPENNAIE